MGERKVLNKYIPPDFDPAKMPRGKKVVQGRMDMTMMLPMSVQCEKCGNFMYRGTKFNSKKEDVLGETYMGMKIFRFIIKCTQCNGFFSFKTDPKNADYVVEYGVSRNFEPWREQRAEVAEEKVAREEEEKSDAIRALELRTEDSRRQLEMLDELEELRALKASHGVTESLSTQEIMARTSGSASSAAAAAADDEEDAAAARAAFASARRAASRGPDSVSASSSHRQSSAAVAVGAGAAADTEPALSAGMKRQREGGPAAAEPRRLLQQPNVLATSSSSTRPLAASATSSMVSGTSMSAMEGRSGGGAAVDGVNGGAVKPELPANLRAVLGLTASIRVTGNLSVLPPAQPATVSSGSATQAQAIAPARPQPVLAAEIKPAATQANAVGGLVGYDSSSDDAE